MPPLVSNEGQRVLFTQDHGNISQQISFNRNMFRRLLLLFINIVCFIPCVLGILE